MLTLRVLGIVCTRHNWLPFSKFPVPLCSSMDAVCVVCCEPFYGYCLGSCDHRAMCMPCGLRLRTFFDDKRCPVCKVGCVRSLPRVPPPTLLACCSPRVGTSSYCQVRCCLLLRALRLCNHWRAPCEALPSVMFSPPLLVSLPRALGWESLLPIAFLHTHPGEPLFRLE